MQLANLLWILQAQVTPKITPKINPPAPIPAPLSSPFPTQLPTPLASPTASQLPIQAGGEGILATILIVIFILVSLTLIFFVLIQTTKSEGLSGMIGGASQSVFRGKKSVEEKLGQWTTYFAVAFLVIAVLISILTYRK